ncbi:DUF2848 family protein [Halopenitus persicus]|uniref:DUF2848 domain-containing protein n=1 Tax=Halopenitus persicus TaxID=1048396 RepID=A0A1H3L333_9EURY|nr:DUF2848 family protein [Halopenitus persicus]QHS18094.1 DUF2848 domain-containing protein [haloarchaeon 3A1-DGR]SDY58842.1 Protein of unknown function [Halopenitus persicus]
MLRLNVHGEVVTVAVDRVINAGYSGRDEDAVQAHIDELVADGIPAPETVPATYELSPNVLRVDPDAVRVAGTNTSGEAEFGLVVTGGETYVVAASDQTDRDLERDSIQKAKQIAPNVLSGDAWRLSDVRDHWDEIELRAWNTVDGERRRYQEATFEAIREPTDLLETVADRYEGPLDGTALLSGTVATVDGELAPGSRFEVAIHDPVTDRELSVAYDVETM